MKRARKLPKSKFVRGILRKLKFSEESLDYVETLLDIERAVTTGASCMAENMRRGYLLEQHPVEADAIYRELNPEGYRFWKREQRRLEREGREPRPPTKREQARERKRHRAAWRRLGGR